MTIKRFWPILIILLIFSHGSSAAENQKDIQKRFNFLDGPFNKYASSVVHKQFNFHIVDSGVCGLSNMSLKDFITSTWVGRIPSIILYAYLGFLTGYTLSSGNLSPHSSAGSITLVIGLVAMIILTEYAVRLSKKTLQENYSL